MVKLLHLAFVAVLLISYGHCEDETEEQDEKVEITVAQKAPDDCERKSKKLDMLKMHYTGTLTENGKKFDSSHDRQQPFEFQIGTGQVIKGWDEGLMDMCVKEKRKLIIPASKGYGAQGAGNDIPPHASLTFEVELLSIEDGAPPQNVFKEIDADSDSRLSQAEVSDYLKKQSANFPDAEQATDGQHNSLMTEIFAHEDKDKDGYISHEEFNGPKHDEL